MWTLYRASVALHLALAVAVASCYDLRPYCIDSLNDKITPKVLLYQGVAVGTTSVSTSGRPFYSFRGLPYAKPPVGELRFRAPVPVDAGVGKIDATRDAPSCTQKNYLLPVPTLSGQEDCLFLNVYTPWLPNAGPPEVLLPVMVYIHGGGWFTGSGDSIVNGPDRLLNKNIVLVTLNYRLGALGFLSTGDVHAPGNYGLKDQVEALCWVQRNIAAFGGDPGAVTLFGQSAGAASVHYHVLSPMSAGLFHRAISQSGTALGAWAWPADALPIAKRQARFVGCPDEEAAALVACLRSIDARQLTDSGDKFHLTLIQGLPEQYWSIDPLTTFVPTIEEFGTCAFIVEDPLTTIREGRFSRVPWMLGTVASEGIVRALPIASTPLLLAELNANWTTLGPKLFELEKSVPAEAVDELWANVTRFYLDDKLPVESDKAQGFVNMYSDRSFVHGTHKSALLHASRGHDEVYMYHLDYRGLYTYADLFASNPVNYGTSHCDDLIYLFRAPVLFPDWPVGHPDWVLSDVLITLWTNFATHGAPTPSFESHRGRFRLSCDLGAGCDLSQLAWTPISTDPTSPRTEFLSIRRGSQQTLDLTMQTDLLRERMAFWDEAPLAENSAAGLPVRGGLWV